MVERIRSYHSGVRRDAVIVEWYLHSVRLQREQWRQSSQQRNRNADALELLNLEGSGQTRPHEKLDSPVKSVLICRQQAAMWEHEASLETLVNSL